MVSSRAVPITHARAATDSEDGICSGKMLTNFCFICSLRTGTLFCGVVSLVSFLFFATKSKSVCFQILSTLGIIADGALQIQYHIYLPLERSLIFEETLIFVVSLLCIHGAMKVTFTHFSNLLFTFSSNKTGIQIHHTPLAGRHRHHHHHLIPNGNLLHHFASQRFNNHRLSTANLRRWVTL